MTPEVVAMLPYFENKILLQLRDPKPWIVHPGKWGFFSGEIEPAEDPKQAALRELQEELQYTPKCLLQLATVHLPEYDLISHVFYCHLDVPLESLSLQEGQDLGLFSWEEIITKHLMSPRLQQRYPIVDTPFVLGTIKKVLDKMGPKIG